MSILGFMEMGIVESVLYCILAFFICTLFCSIGKLFISGRCIVLQILLGMGLVGAVVQISLLSWTGLAKYIIYTSICTAFVMTMICIFQGWIKLKEIIKALIPVFVIFTFFIIKFMIQIIPQNGVIDYNCHSTYFAAIPLEIFKADYFSRIRVIDVYPYEWAKYHFFNGSFTAIPLSTFIKKNFVTYNLAKYLTISIYMGAIFEQIKLKIGLKKAILHFLIGIGVAFTCAFNLTTWSFFTNNYSCILLMGILWVLFEKKEYRTACLVSILTALSASRMVIIGGMIFIYALFKLYEQNGKAIRILWKKEWKSAVYSLVIGISVLTMVFSGVSVTGNIYFNFEHLYSTLFDRGWTAILPLGAFGQEDTYHVGFEYFILIIYAYLILKNVQKMEHAKFKDFSIMMKLLLIFIGMTVLYIIGHLFYLAIFKPYGIKQVILFTAMFIFLYLAPLVALLLSGSDKLFIALFIISFVMECAVFESSVAICGYSTIFIPLIMSFSNMLSEGLEKNSRKKVMSICLALFSFIYVGVYDFKVTFFANDKDYYHIVLNLREVPYSDEAFEYYSDEDADLAKLNALKGNRIHYNGEPTRNNQVMGMTSMSMSFAVNAHQ